MRTHAPPGIDAPLLAPWERERDACGIGFVADSAGRPARAIVELGLDALTRMRHRGAVDADAKTGDGAGVLAPIPRGFLEEELGIETAEPPGVAMLFLRCGAGGGPAGIVERACQAEGLEVVAWREVPVDAGALGARARVTMPSIVQAVFRRRPGSGGERRERAAFRARRRIEAQARRDRLDLTVVSCSFSTVTYKALVAADQLAPFYRDLRDPRFAAPFIVFHQRYSTNTAPSWERAQPFRVLCHNGEINTLGANVRRMATREGRLGLESSEIEELFRPSVDPEGSDSSMLDETIELLMREGAEREAAHAVAMTVPAAWERRPDMEPRVRGFYRWHASVMEPWDGPAALIFSDGVAVGAAMDRNGLRPLRSAICEDGLVACASEAGAVDVGGHGLVRRGKLGPGDMLVVDPRCRGVELDPVRRIAMSRPYATWASEHRIVLGIDHPAAQVPPDLLRRQTAFGYGREDVTLLLRPMAADGGEPTFSMGDDTPIAPMSARRGSVFGHLKQRFAQVTNPAIDHIRERFVMSTTTLLGPRDPLIWERPQAAAQLELPTFVVFHVPRGEVLDATWAAGDGPEGMRPALERLADAAVEAVGAGHGILVLSDAALDRDRAAIPSLLAVGAVDVALVRAGLRAGCSIVADSGDAIGSHDVACLLAFGAEAVHPRLAFATVSALHPDDDAAAAEALGRYRDAIEHGVLKILARLGIACVDAYRGGASFDVVGLSREVTERCLPGTSSSLGGIGFEAIAAEVLARHDAAFVPAPAPLVNRGAVKFRHGGEYHETNPGVVRAIHRSVDPGLRHLRSTAVRDDDERAAAADEARYAELVDARRPSEPRDLLALRRRGRSVPLEEVEAAPAILRRFSSAAMSHGAISREAHETLALAMAIVGGRSNAGEGGEDAARFRTRRNSTIKQIASARFGVTPEYCAFADELQIKIAQGSKPGEGGQLPGHKVTAEIAAIRHTQPGVALLSPAPHHDIYSIEDLAQLVFDLRQVNPDADISVKLVSEIGVGAIATGVAKALADIVHVAGADGGTGASPLSSIKNVGLPWEIGLAETNRALVRSGLRRRLRVRVDGGLKTGRDVVLAALLGADEFSFGTALLLAEGCIMVRTCHLDTCPVGIATQRPELRARFAGTPEMVVSYLTSVAEDVRRTLADLGLRSLEDAIGRVDLLVPADGAGADGLDLSELLEPSGERRRLATTPPVPASRSDLGDRLHRDGWAAVSTGAHATLRYPITIEDRAVGARLGGAIGRRFGTDEPPGSVRATFDGAAGQSFGAFLASGVDLRLIGEANDHVGKGMSGGRIVISPPADDVGDAHLAGNAVLYGATGGELFVAGRVGERFAVRNSGAVAVVEGMGEHGCEYMTGGLVVVLGPFGMNLGAGMTGGAIYVRDPDGALPAMLNPELVWITRPLPEERDEVRRLVSLHASLTGSERAARVLEMWAADRRILWRVVPRDGTAEADRRRATASQRLPVGQRA
ncbi:MAG TPA: glutamate synthase large subunit [Actinomycetota bacterium]|nr:glutamate synthase large subunit [Actinomycetota bacterium]